LLFIFGIKAKRFRNLVKINRTILLQAIQTVTRSKSTLPVTQRVFNNPVYTQHCRFNLQTFTLSHAITFFALITTDNTDIIIQRMVIRNVITTIDGLPDTGQLEVGIKRMSALIYNGAAVLTT